MKDYSDKDFKDQAKAECMFAAPMLVIVAIMWAVAIIYSI